MSGLFLKSNDRYDLILNVSTPSPDEWRFQKSDGSGPEDWTGSTFELNVTARDSNRDPTGAVVLTLSSGSGIAGDESLGEVFPTFPASADGGLPANGGYVFQLDRLVSAVVVETILVGQIDTTAGIS